MLFWFDIGISVFFLCFGIYFVWHAFKDIHEGWPWLVSAASGVWVVGYVLFDRWLQGRDAAHYDESVLAHVEWSIKDLGHRLWLDRYTFWWYILPIASGCMIPPILFFAMQYGTRPLVGALVSLLGSEVVFVLTIGFVHGVMKYAQRMGLEARSKKLQALRELRDMLLNREPGS